MKRKNVSVIELDIFFTLATLRLYIILCGICRFVRGLFSKIILQKINSSLPESCNRF
jgi:hypothetical protein